MGCDRPFDPLRVKRAPRRGRKKRKSATATDRDGGASTSRPLGPLEWIEIEMAVMRELLGGLPKPLSSNRPSTSRPSTSTIAADTGETQGASGALSQAHVELWDDLEKEKKKRHSQDKLLVRVWKGVKSILKYLTPGTSTPRVTRRDLLEFSFLTGF